MPQIVDMLVDCMMDNPRFALAISEASRCYKTQQYALRKTKEVGIKPENVVRYYSTWRRPDIIIQLLKVPQPPADIPFANGKKLN